MENEKYYTPELEEFYIGFEYEVWESVGYSKEHWTKKVHTIKNENGSYTSDLTLIDDGCNKARVKYLDQEDIESFGFDLGQCTKDGYYFIKGTMLTKHEWVLTFGGKTNPENYLSICDMNEALGNCFTGTVKNKSELKKILSMLGIEV